MNAIGAVCVTLLTALSFDARSQGNVLSTDPTWFSGPQYSTQVMILGDVDGDGDLDLVCVNSDREPNTLYENVNDVLTIQAKWESGPRLITRGGALGDVGDGFQSEGGTLEIKRAPNGPLLVNGSFTLRAGSGRAGWRGTKAALCRCGESKNKPFCDGAHAATGFQAD